MKHTVKTTVIAKSYGADVLPDRKWFTAMIKHAGRTGVKVHLTTLIHWPSGQWTTGQAHCNQRLRGTLVSGQDFSAVTCERCNATAEKAAERNAKAIVIDVEVR